MKKNVLIAFLFLAGGVATARVVDVTMTGFAFVPDTVSVSQGDTVRWTNNDGVAHTSTSGKYDSAPGALWDSPYLSTGQSFTLPVTFAAGDIPYYCRPHYLTMKGMLTVSSGVNDEPGRSVPSLRLSLRSLNPDAVSFELPSRLNVSLRVYDASGQERAELLRDATFEPGLHRVSLAGLELKNGFYIVSLSAGAAERAARMVVLD